MRIDSIALNRHVSGDRIDAVRLHARGFSPRSAIVDLPVIAVVVVAYIAIAVSALIVQVAAAADVAANAEKSVDSRESPMKASSHVLCISQIPHYL
ncbi:hypothetical protein AU512_03285 [Lonsdalea iberica]|uniref:Uncharacterized protein n=1 Tax=Lonsdalea iberica TaxID=1082703 RepID=A0ABX3XJU7_9GAMM|nr:hypothetical protein AU512_03285 [Lonsdalea iberica]